LSSHTCGRFLNVWGRLVNKQAKPATGSGLT
jgi:hypothetical protein